MTKQMITESELMNLSKGLKQYLGINEAFDPAVQKRQQELIAAGAKIKADGFMGPKTQAAEKEFGGQADVMAANEKDKAAAAAAPAVAPAPAVDPRQQYDQFKADDAKAAAVAAVKKLTAPVGGANYVDPKDGVIKYQDQAMGGGVKEFPYDWFTKGQEAPFFSQLKAAGLEVKPVDRPGLFGMKSQVAGVDPAALTKLLTPAPAAAPTAAAPGAQSNPSNATANTTQGPPPGSPAGVAATAPAAAPATAPVKETTGYSDEQVLARIVDLARR